MTTQTATRKVKRSFTLSPESVAFVRETRQRRQAHSDSEALDLLLREQVLEAKRQQLEAETKAYYDSASDKELREASEWAQMAGPTVLLSSEPNKAEQ